MFVERPATVEEGFSQNNPLVYHYGHNSPGYYKLHYNIRASTTVSVEMSTTVDCYDCDNCCCVAGQNHVLYNQLVSRLADVVRERMKASRKTDISGVVINTCGWVQGGGYDQIKHIAQVETINFSNITDCG